MVCNTIRPAVNKQNERRIQWYRPNKQIESNERKIKLRVKFDKNLK